MVSRSYPRKKHLKNYTTKKRWGGNRLRMPLFIENAHSQSIVKRGMQIGSCKVATIL